MQSADFDDATSKWSAALVRVLALYGIRIWPMSGSQIGVWPDCLKSTWQPKTVHDASPPATLLASSWNVRSKRFGSSTVASAASMPASCRQRAELRLIQIEVKRRGCRGRNEDVVARCGGSLREIERAAA